MRALPTQSLVVSAALVLSACDGSLGSGDSDANRRDARAPSDAPGLDAQASDVWTNEDADRPDAFAPIELDASLIAPLDAAMTVAPDASAPDAFAPVDAFVPADAFMPSPPPTYQTFFSTRPAADGADTTLEDAVYALIEAAIPGSQIRVAVYSFTRDRVADALVRARMRGVDVRVIVDGDVPSSAGGEHATLVSGLGAGNGHACDAPGTACVGSGIMHHKTFLFSALSDGSRNVVMQSSHNLTNNQLNLHNNAVVIRGDTALYNAYLRTWNDLFADVENPNYYRIDDGALARVYFFPRNDGGDTVVSILDNVRCDATSRIRVEMAFFTDARRDIATALAARQREGCDVRVVVGDAEIPLGSAVASTLTGAGVRLTRYPARTGGWTIHSKYLLIDAPYVDAGPHRRLVFTGSHNWTGPALTINDETLLRVEDDGVFAAYLADWERTRVAAARP